MIECVDADGSGSDDLNVIRIAPYSGSAVMLGRDGIGTFVSGALSGNFITGTFYGDASEVRGVVHQLNSLTGSFEIVAGPNTNIVTDNTVFPTQIVISSSVPATGSDELVKITSNDTTSDYLFNKLVAGPNIVITEANDGGDEKIVISGSASGGGISGSEHRDLDQLVHDISESSYEEYIYDCSRITNLITWTDNSKTTKIREEQYNFSGCKQKLSSSVVIQYDAAGAEVERITDYYTYLGNRVVSVDRVLS